MSSTGSTEAPKEPLKVYPPGAPIAMETGEAVQTVEEGEGKVGGSSSTTGEGKEEDEAEPEPVGEFPSIMIISLNGG